MRSASILFIEYNNMNGEKGKNMDGNKNKNVHEKEKGREDRDHYVVEEDRKLWDV